METIIHYSNGKSRTVDSRYITEEAFSVGHIANWIEPPGSTTNGIWAETVEVAEDHSEIWIEEKNA